ncbi:hypothetical protein SAMN05660964_00079 [Thiothrix caldifontis]|uniref:Uncharacterized protein n=1 Tax=Thiothrix caldifontis TaxID=525918 RepID=A0A1H3VH43_9GAMM|nr:hypothetical protein [Thiothrix caldifontis]SDZ74123.1 hypothetical protein SAMN05660964_00079 [Thiothrix caldifontis]
MFKKNKVAISVATGILGVVGVITSVQAVHINPDGTGQVLLFPYYNGTGGYVTNINLVNSTDQTKAVKIRFREGKTSHDVLDFNIYMSPEDVWTGTVKNGQDASGNWTGVLSTTDRTCTLPALASCDDGKCLAEQPFNGHNIYQGVTGADTKEGYVEVIEMGVVDDITVKQGVLHNNGKPNNCKTVEEAWTKGTFTQGEGASAKGLSAPTGGLFGSSAVINIAKGSAFALDPIAIDNYSTQAQHYLSHDPENFLLPSLASGNVASSSIMVRNASGEGEMVVTDWNVQADACLEDKDELTPRCGTNPYPIAHVLLAPHVMNEYFVDPTDGYDGHTDWVITFPMKKHGIHQDVVANFENGIFDREETKAGFSKPNSGFGFSPVLPGKKPDSSTLNREVNVISFKSTDPSYDDSRTVLSSYAKQSVTTGAFVSGWARLGFTGYDLKAGFKAAQAYGSTAGTYNADSNIYKGVPAVGSAFLEGNISENPNARFGDALPHKVQR